MHRLIFTASILSLTPRFLAPDTGGSTGNGVPQTIEQRLTATVNEADTLRSQVTSLTTERDTAKSSLISLQAQFDELSRTATESKTKLTAAESDLATTKQTLTAAQSSLETEKKSVSRLETLCGVKGLDPQAAPPTLGAGTEVSENVYDQWVQATGAEKSKLWSEHRAEIRSEGERRAKAGNR